MSGIKSMLAFMAATAALNDGTGHSYMDGACTCAACKAKGVDKDANGDSVCPACPYYEYSLIIPEEEE